MITALTITYNEEERIANHIDQLGFAHEIIVVDSFSTDKTREIALKKGAKVLEHEFSDFSSQKNAALEEASYDWIVFFDPDERISEALKTEIIKKVDNPEGHVAFKVKRHFFFMGKRLKYSGYQNDTVIRLFKKDHCHYVNKVHENLKVDGSVGQFTTPLDHYSYSDFDRYNQKLTLYSKLQAQTLFESGIRPNLYHFLIRPAYRFWHQYLIRLGILDGKEGFIHAYISAFSVFKRYLFLWTKYRSIS